MTNDSHLISEDEIPHQINNSDRRIHIKLAHPALGDEELAAISDVFRSGRLVQGPVVESFESDLADFLAVNHAIVVSSGTAALHLTLLALDFAPGEILFVPSFAWPSAANMVTRLGAIPVFIDCLSNTNNVDPDNLRARIDESIRQNYGRPKAILAVHEFGLACDLDSVMAIAKEYNLAVIEDAACALGAKYNGKAVGSFGRMGIFSFHPRKSITTGEGGVIVTNDDTLNSRLRALRNHGQTYGGRYQFETCGFNYRMTEMQAAMGKVQLGKLGGILERKREIAALYSSKLSGHPLVSPPDCNDDHTWQTYMVCLEKSVDRSSVIIAMADAGIEVGPGAMAAHSLPMFSELPGAKELAVTKQLAEQGLALPMHAGLSDTDITEVVDTLIASLT